LRSACSARASSKPERPRFLDRAEELAVRGAAQFTADRQLLVQLFARAQAGDDDLDVARRDWRRRAPNSPSLDHLPRQIGDAHRLAHVEHEDLATRARSRPRAPGAWLPARS
jgi:hypothetical protein